METQLYPQFTSQGGTLKERRLVSFDQPTLQPIGNSEDAPNTNDTASAKPEQDESVDKKNNAPKDDVEALQQIKERMEKAEEKSHKLQLALDAADVQIEELQLVLEDKSLDEGERGMKKEELEKAKVEREKIVQQKENVDDAYYKDAEARFEAEVKVEGSMSKLEGTSVTIDKKKQAEMHARAVDSSKEAIAKIDERLEKLPEGSATRAKVLEERAEAVADLGQSQEMKRGADRELLDEETGGASLEELEASLKELEKAKSGVHMNLAIAKKNSSPEVAKLEQQEQELIGKITKQQEFITRKKALGPDEVAAPNPDAQKLEGLKEQSKTLGKDAEFQRNRITRLKRELSKAPKNIEKAKKLKEAQDAYDALMGKKKEVDAAIQKIENPNEGNADGPAENEEQKPLTGKEQDWAKFLEYLTGDKKSAEELARAIVSFMYLFKKKPAESKSDPKTASDGDGSPDSAEGDKKDKKEGEKKDDTDGKPKNATERIVTSGKTERVREMMREAGVKNVDELFKKKSEELGTASPEEAEKINTLLTDINEVKADLKKTLKDTNTAFKNISDNLSLRTSVGVSANDLNTLLFNIQLKEAENGIDPQLVIKSRSGLDVGEVVEELKQSGVDTSGFKINEFTGKIENPSAFIGAIQKQFEELKEGNYLTKTTEGLSYDTVDQMFTNIDKVGGKHLAETFFDTYMYNKDVSKPAKQQLRKAVNDRLGKLTNENLELFATLKASDTLGVTRREAMELGKVLMENGASVEVSERGYIKTSLTSEKAQKIAANIGDDAEPFVKNYLRHLKG